MPEPTREDLVARIAALEKQLAAAQSGSGASVQGQDNVVSGAGGLSVGRDFIGNVYQGAPPQNDAEGVALYRRMLARSASQLPLRGVHVGASDPTSNEKQLDLDHVYVNLDTTTQFQPGEETEPKGFAPASWLQRLAAKLLPGSRRQPVEEALVTASGREREATKPLPALLATALNRRLVLLGDPGSGKSTFVNHLSLCLALHGLEPAQHWCDRLAGWPAEEADLLPVLVILRDFARTLPAKPSPADAGTLWDFITERLTKQRLGAVAKPLEDALDAGRAIVLLDGLDEIATPAHRQFLREAVLQFIERYHRSRFLVTCRTLSYQDSAWKLKFKDSAGREQDFPAFTLAPFDEPKIDQFIAAWFGDLGRLGVVKTEDAEPLTRGLQTALRRPGLWQLASNPLLLTVMALVHTHKGRLPDARALLYEDTVDILLWRWEQIKLASETETPGLRQLLVETGRSDVDLKRTLWRLAYEAHGAGGHKERLADIGELALQTALAELHPHEDRQWAWNVIETIKHRAGLLLERLPQVYTFPHRTFQEYLAGAHLASQARFALESAKLVEAGAFWREVILLAVGKLVYLHGDTDKPLALVGELCPEHGATTRLGWQQAWLAGEVLCELGLPRVREGALGRDLLERVQGRLAQLLEAGALAPVERAKAGVALGKLGDPRPGVGLDKDGLPDIVFEEQVFPAGDFTLGETRKPVRIKQRYQIARYPVTVAQFEAFLKAPDGYHHEQCWQRKDAPDMLEWWKENHEQGPGNYDPVFQTPNHPRVGVCWYEAVAFGRWLSRKRGLDPDGPEAIRLPHEAEWEQAARWNGQAADGRTYPWGECSEEELAQYCNCYGTGLGHTSAVGLFPKGKAACGAMDLAGNVWEWCDNRYDEKRNEARRVLRGGSWRSHRDDARAAFRDRDHPGFRIDVVGVRLVRVSPIFE